MAFKGVLLARSSPDLKRKVSNYMCMTYTILQMCTSFVLQCFMIILLFLHIIFAPGFKLQAMKLATPPRDLLEAHYADLSSKGFFAGLIDYMSR